MEVKRAKVIMLPTEDSSNIVILGYAKNLPTYRDVPYSFGAHHIPQHLYITTDDEIKEGDWFIHPDSLKPINDLEYWYIDCKKIIATTDKSLTIGEEDSWKNRKDILYPNSLPQPSQAFIEKYCELGGIDEVDVEYNIDLRTVDYVIQRLILKVDSHNTITIHPIKNSWSKKELQTLCYNNPNDQVLGALLRKIIL